MSGPGSQLPRPTAEEAGQYGRWTWLDVARRATADPAALAARMAGLAGVDATYLLAVEAELLDAAGRRGGDAGGVADA
jgi:hypothetical protein